METATVERATYTVDETAALLGIDRKGAYAAIKRGEIRAIKLGGRIVVPMAAIEQMLNGSAA